MKHLLRTRFKEEIVAEFLPAKDFASRKVIILCDGMPGVPGKKKLIEFLAKKNYWVFHPRYRGAWESGGEMLAEEPTKDIFDVIDELPKGFVSLWDKTEYVVDPEEIIVIGASFGGPAAILSTLDPRVSKGIVISPVVDWVAEQNAIDEPMDFLEEFTKSAFGDGYRFSHENWMRLTRGELYNPVDKLSTLDKDKIMIIHAQDDTAVHTESVIAFATELDCQFHLLKSGGHFSANKIMHWKMWWKVKRVLP